MEIEILNYTPVIGKGSVLAEFTLRINAGKRFQEINMCKVLVNKNGTNFWTFPSFIKGMENDKKIYIPSNRFDEETEREIKAKTLEAVKLFATTH